MFVVGSGRDYQTFYVIPSGAKNAGFSFDLKFNAQFTSLTVIMRERLSATVIIPHNREIANLLRHSERSKRRTHLIENNNPFLSFRGLAEESGEAQRNNKCGYAWILRLRFAPLRMT